MPLIARQRSRLAVLAVLALVGSLLAVSAVPAVAAPDGKASAKAEFSACVAAATDDAGFTDMDGNFAEDEANCLAHYGITVGTTEGVFSPNDSITRAQMALFLVRAAGPAGMDLADPADQGFDDIGNWTDAIQDAINQVAAAGIIEGHDNAFNPTGGVSRMDMAVFLDAFLEEADIELDSKAEVPYNIHPDDIDTPFKDIGSVTFAAYGAINRLYELGVASGTGDGTTFSPDMHLSRAQMAVFITRALAHTNARPAGLSVQTTPVKAYEIQTPRIQASLRDANHEPISDALVEVFSAQSAVDAFNDEGECSEDLKDEALGSIGGTRCEIDASDEATEPDGNVFLDIDGDEFCAGDTTLWLWSGEIGDAFNADETEFASTEINVTATPDDVTVKSDKPSVARFLELGDTANFVLQVVDTNGEPEPIEGLILVVRSTEMRNGALLLDSVTNHKTDASGRVELSFTHNDPRPGDDRQGDSASVEVTVNEVQNADGTAHPWITPTGTDKVEWSDRDPVAFNLSLSQSVSYHKASDEGSGVRNTVRATLVDQYGDPISGAKIRFWSDANNFDGTEDSPISWNDGLGGFDRYDFADDQADIENEALDIETGDIKTNTDGIAIAIAAPDVHNYADERVTNRRGVATKSYSRDADGALVETISAAYNHNPDDGDDDLMEGEDPANNPDFTDTGAPVDGVSADPYYIGPDPDTNDPHPEFGMRALDLTTTMVHYWATTAEDDESTALTVVAVETDNNRVVATDFVVGTDTPAATDKVLIVTYDGNDQFNVGASGSETRVTSSFFEKQLTAGDSDTDASTITFELEEEPEPEVNRFTIVNASAPAGGKVRCV